MGEMNEPKFRKSVVSCAVVSVLGLNIPNATADIIEKIKIEDVGSTVAGAFNSALDGNSGGFRFGPINPETYLGVSTWTGDVGTGDMIWQGQINNTGSFSTGFIFGGSPFVPYTYGNNANGEINILDAAGNAGLTVSSLDFGGNFAGLINFNLPPDNPPGIQTNWLVNNGDGTYKVSFQWEHYITTADDPSGSYVGFNTRWIIEGTATLQNGPPRIELSGGAVDVPLGSPYVEPGADCLDTIDGPINNKLVVTTNPVTDLNNPTADFQVIYNCQDSGWSGCTHTIQRCNRIDRSRYHSTGHHPECLHV